VIRLGGYFVRRQFNQFAACKTGKRTQDFVQKLLTKGHARMTASRHARQVIHVHCKPLYLALDCDQNRNRRAHQPRAILARLMALDYQLSNPKPCCWPANSPNGPTSASIMESRVRPPVAGSKGC
jgi:hypothetical protein